MKLRGGGPGFASSPIECEALPGLKLPPDRWRDSVPSASIQALRTAVGLLVGPDRVLLYGSSEREEHATAFRILDVPATFSVHTREGELPAGKYDIQIESFPPGEYLHTSGVSLEEFLELVRRMHGPEGQWP